jgi:hypothetical protein
MAPPSASPITMCESDSAAGEGDRVATRDVVEGGKPPRRFLTIDYPLQIDLMPMVSRVAASKRLRTSRVWRTPSTTAPMARRSPSPYGGGAER